MQRPLPASALAVPDSEQNKSKQSPILCITHLNVISAYLVDNPCNQTRLALPYTCLFWERICQNRMTFATSTLTFDF